jgi:hypothetical protein
MISVVHPEPFAIGALMLVFGVVCNLIGIVPGGNSPDEWSPATRRSEHPIAFRNTIRIFVICGLLFMAAGFLPKNFSDPEFLSPLKKFFEFGAKYY